MDSSWWIDNKKKAGEKTFVLTDANQTMREKTTAYSLRKLTEDCGLTRVMELKHAQTLRSLDRGTKTIDHIITKDVKSDAVRKAGQLFFGLGFSSDHRIVYADLNANKLLRLIMEEPAQKVGRRLSSKNAKLKGNIQEIITWQPGIIE